MDFCFSLYHLTLFSSTEISMQFCGVNVTIYYEGGYRMTKLKSYLNLFLNDLLLTVIVTATFL